MNCILERNPLSGFRRSHSIFCLYCEEEATIHFNVGYACGNVCESCGKKRFNSRDIQSGRYIQSELEEERRSDEASKISGVGPAVGDISSSAGTNQQPEC